MIESFSHTKTLLIGLDDLLLFGAFYFSEMPFFNKLLQLKIGAMSYNQPGLLF